ncbi:UNKNOWN [Stylonychia lemnae]|uniref:Uncharacterized protein n=1 Tax=Stylonychia lemnae TaxID=5949 RepID=A0A078B1W5_STYLE|nr:UNKNOWN [Stylonychia lemnae]|eukprot:CDW88494.1 UNKNOWN [Stylonychia lemnae]
MNWKLEFFDSQEKQLINFFREAARQQIDKPSYQIFLKIIKENQNFLPSQNKDQRYVLIKIFGSSKLLQQKVGLWTLLLIQKSSCNNGKQNTDSQSLSQVMNEATLRSKLQLFNSYQSQTHEKIPKEKCLVSMNQLLNGSVQQV